MCSAIMVLILSPIIQYRFRTVQERFADVSDKVQENLSGIRVIKGYVQETQEIEKLSHASQRRMDTQMAYVRFSALHDPSVQFFFGVSFVLNTETIIQDSLTKIPQDRTMLVVAHQLSTIQHADKIIVMHKDRIREVGNHAELPGKGGIYSRLYTLQYAHVQG